MKRGIEDACTDDIIQSSSTTPSNSSQQITPNNSSPSSLSSNSSSSSFSPTNGVYMTTTVSNGTSQLILMPAPIQQQQQQPQLLTQQQQQQQTQDHKPEAKKVKIQKSQPSKVVHIRNIPPQLSEIEIIQFGLIFGNVINVLNLRSKCQAFLEFDKNEEAHSMCSYFTNNPITVAGRQIFVQYSNYKTLVTDPNNSNNQIARAALDTAKDLHKAAQTGGQNTILRAMIQNMLYLVSMDTIYQIFSRFGPVLKIITFTKNDKYQALIQMKDAQAAQTAKNTLHGQNIFTGCCTLHIDYSKLNTLNVKYNNEKSRDYTNPLLPPGDCDHLALSNLLAAGNILTIPSFTTPATAQPTTAAFFAPQGLAASPFLTSTNPNTTFQSILTPNGLIRTASTPITAATNVTTQSTNANTTQTLAQLQQQIQLATQQTLNLSNQTQSTQSPATVTTATGQQLLIPIVDNENVSLSLE